MEQIINLIDIELIHLVIGLIALMVANILLGSIDALLNQQFNTKVLKQGIIKAIVVAISFILTYVAGYLNPDILAIEVNGETVNLIIAVTMILIAGFVYYGNEVLKKLIVFVKGKINIGEGM